MVRRMTYLALSYDHRLIDGREGDAVPGDGEGTGRGPRWILPEAEGPSKLGWTVCLASAP